MARHGTANGGVPPAPKYPRRGEYRESKCNACCKTPFGCGRNFICYCHKTTKETS